MLFRIIPRDAFTPGSLSEVWSLPQNEKKEVFVPSGNYYQRYGAEGFLCQSAFGDTLHCERTETDGSLILTSRESHSTH
jgi:hypothetical protein